MKRAFVCVGGQVSKPRPDPGGVCTNQVRHMLIYLPVSQAICIQTIPIMRRIRPRPRHLMMPLVWLTAAEVLFRVIQQNPLEAGIVVVTKRRMVSLPFRRVSCTRR
jgi:hypothetical protein